MLRQCRLFCVMQILFFFFYLLPCVFWHEQALFRHHVPATLFCSPNQGGIHVLFEVNHCYVVSFIKGALHHLKLMNAKTAGGNLHRKVAHSCSCLSLTHDPLQGYKALLAIIYLFYLNVRCRHSSEALGQGEPVHVMTNSDWQWKYCSDKNKKLQR